MSDHYCINCDKKVPIWPRRRRVRFPLYKKDGIWWLVEAYVTYEEEYAVCQFCGHEVYVPEINDRNVKARGEAIRQYRKENSNDSDNL